jgi:hypothetical protein
MAPASSAEVLSDLRVKICRRSISRKPRIAEFTENFRGERRDVPSRFAFVAKPYEDINE